MGEDPVRVDKARASSLKFLRSPHSLHWDSSSLLFPFSTPLRFYHHSTMSAIQLEPPHVEADNKGMADTKGIVAAVEHDGGKAREITDIEILADNIDREAEAR